MNVSKTPGVTTGAVCAIRLCTIFFGYFCGAILAFVDLSNLETHRRLLRVVHSLRFVPKASVRILVGTVTHLFSGA